MALNVSINFKAFDRLSRPTREMNETLGTFGARVSQLKTQLGSLGRQQNDIDKFKALKLHVGQTAAVLDQAQAEAQKLNKAMAGNDAPSKKMIANAERAAGRVRSLKAAQQDEVRELDRLRRSLSEAGVNTRNLATDNRRLKEATQAVNDQLELRTNLAKRESAISETLQRRSSLSANISFAAASTKTVADGINTRIGSLVQKAVSLEEAMAEVNKVVGFENPDDLKALEDELVLLSTKRKIPLSVPQLAEITAAAAQANIANEDLVEFTEGVAKAAIAFDILPSAAGENFAKIRNVLRLSIDDTFLLGDAINHLSNNDAAEASQILDGLRRSGGDAVAFGLSPVESAALQSSLVALGVQSETASRALNSMFSKLLTIKDKGPQVQDALQSIGLSAQELQESIERDASGALVDFFQRVDGLDRVERATLLSRIFGEGFQDDLGKLASGIETVETAFANVADTTAFAGSTQEEFEKRAATTAGQMQRYRNQVDSLKATLGESLLPTINAMLGRLGKVATGLRNWSKENPVLSKTVLTLALGLGVTLAVLAPLMTLVSAAIGTWALYSFAVSKTSISLALNRASIIATTVAIKTKTAALLTLARSAITASIRGIASLSVAAWGLATRTLPVVIAGVRTLTLALLRNPIVLVATAIAGAAFLIYKNWQPISGFFGRIWSGVKNKVASAWTTIKGIVSWTPLGLLTKNWGALPQVFKGALERVKSLMSAAMDRVKALITGPFERIKKLGEGIRRLFGLGSRAATGAVAGAALASTPAFAATHANTVGILAPGSANADQTAAFILAGGDPSLPAAPNAGGKGPLANQGGGNTFNSTYNVTAPAGTDPEAIAQELNRLNKRDMDRALFDAE